MRDNTVKVDGIEVYEDQIYELADQYIREELGGDEERLARGFPGMLLYIHDRIPKPSNDDIKLLDAIFNIYIRLCCRYEALPSLEGFSFLVGINRCTFSDWAAGQYRKSSGHGNTVKTWADICKSFTIDRLHNSGKVDVNLIFVAKAAYQMRETAPLPAEETLNGPTLTREEIASRYAAFKEAPERLELDEIE